ncbi:MAG: hypothetical protein GY803_09160, partial [Chloroflexi bacterium]|nr:hypothetical protein [Chloroflexota bacterium]
LAAIVGDEEQEGVIASGDGRRHSGKSARQFHPPISLNLILIDAATGKNRHLATFQPTIVFITQFLPFFDQFALSHRIWSPQSDALVLPLRDEEVNRIAVIPIDSGQPHYLTEGDMPFWSQQ